MTPLNFEAARTSMILNQMRAWHVHDDRILELIARMPREDFVPAAFRSLAYADMNVPLGHGQVMIAPKLAGRLLQALAAGAKDKILEVGTGSGYITAALADLASHVYSVEIIPELAGEAQQKLSAHGIRNATVEIGDAALGWPRHAPYDAILVTGSLPLVPNPLREQLAPRGRLVAVVGRAPSMEVLLIERIDEYNWSQTSVLETVVPPLVNAPEPSKFVF